MVQVVQVMQVTQVLEVGHVVRMISLDDRHAENIIKWPERKVENS